jgi:hypothetical protein
VKIIGPCGPWAFPVVPSHGPLTEAEDALTAAATARVDALMQRRLVAAVCAPVGIEHLEDREVLDGLASARGELLGGQPAGAPLALISSLGSSSGVA